MEAPVGGIAGRHIADQILRVQLARNLLRRCLDLAFAIGLKIAAAGMIADSIQQVRPGDLFRPRA